MMYLEFSPCTWKKSLNKIKWLELKYDIICLLFKLEHDDLTAGVSVRLRPSVPAHTVCVL